MFLLNVNFENLTLGLHVLYILQFNIANKLNNHQHQIMNRLCKMGFCYSVCAKSYASTTELGTTLCHNSPHDEL